MVVVVFVVVVVVDVSVGDSLKSVSIWIVVIVAELFRQ